ncbi:hypothetical protein FRC02_004515, partial [Tulasnella sp. 418]
MKDLTELLTAIPAQKQSEDPFVFNNRIAKLTSDIERTVEDCGKIRSQSKANKFFSHQDNASAINGINRSIERAIRTFQLGGDIAMERDIKGIAQGVEEIRLHLKRSDMADPLQALKLNVADASFDSQSRATTISRCFEGTRTELLQTIYNWADDPGSKSIYWLCGLAGTGKSTIAQTVAEGFDERGVLGASFFFSRGVEKRDDPRFTFPTIAYQLGCFNDTFGARIADSLRRHPSACDAILRTQLEKLIVGPLQDVDRGPPVVIIVLDALDECSDKQLVKEMLALLVSAIPKFPFSLQVFITSRPDFHILSEFRGPGMKSVSEVTLLHEVDISVVQNDIRIYFDHHLRVIGEIMLGNGGWPSEEELNAIVEQAKGLFIYASASVAYIGDLENPDPQERLKTLLSEKMMIEASPFSGIDKLYNHILYNSLPRFGAWNSARKLRNILGAILLLLNPLTVPSIEKLVSVGEGTVRPMLIPLHSVLSGTEDPKRPVQAFHKSFIDFMLNPRRCTDSRLYIDPNIHHTQLALQCLQHMNTGLRRNMCDSPNRFAMNAEILNIDESLRTQVGPHLIYACCFWAFHLKHADRTDQVLRNAVSLFSATALLYWLEILSLAMRLPLANQSLKIAQGWYTEEQSMRLTLVQKAIPVSEHLGILKEPLKSVEEKILQSTTPTKGLLHDCERFVLRFFKVISDSAQHIYHSALPFTPQCLFHEQYKDELKGAVKITQMEDGWDPILSVLHGHLGNVRSVAFSPDGSRIVSGSDDHSVRIWDTSTGSCVRILEGHTNQVQSTCFSPDGTVAASSSDDGTLRLWDPSTGEHLKTFGGTSF